MTLLIDGLISDEDIAELGAMEGLNFDKARSSILKSMNSINVQACPGSGKTTLIAAKLILLAKKWPYHDRGICVLSHTNVAKNEIIDRLINSKTREARNLLSYPHFIGTIQEFVGKYISHPILRSEAIHINQVDTDVCVDLIYSRLSHGTRKYIDGKNKYSNVLYDFELKYENKDFSFKIPTWPNGSATNSYKNLENVRTNLFLEGYFFYRDIFTCADMVLNECPYIKQQLQSRFPFIFIDEMQDTQEYQDIIISQFFPQKSTAIAVQIFGDPDQAIFNGIKSEKPNRSYNIRKRCEMDFVIEKSHRFDDSIAKKISKLSYNEIPLETELAQPSIQERRQIHNSTGDFQHTILLYNDKTIQKVIPAYADLVSGQFSASYKNKEVNGKKMFCVKAIGAVGKEIENEADLRIGNFWPEFHKEKSIKGFKEKTFIDLVRYCRKSQNIDWAQNYKLLFSGYLKIIRISGKMDAECRYFNNSTFRTFIEERGYWKRLQYLSYALLLDKYSLDETFWKKVQDFMRTAFELSVPSSEVDEYLKYENQPAAVDSNVNSKELKLNKLPDNKILHRKDNFHIELSTIHGVKGETHDATLILETRNNVKDIEVMIDFLTGDRPASDFPNQSLKETPKCKAANKQFLRQLYVAASRPRHLLCLAINEKHINDKQFKALQKLGWNFGPEPETEQELRHG